jgi:hypothetical protein
MHDRHINFFEGDTSMKRRHITAALFALCLLLLTYVPTSSADEWDKTTKLTFNEPVQVPGKVLPAGTYVFRLQDSSSDRHIVQIYNEDHTQLITTVLAIPNERLEPTDKTVLTYDERPADQPVALAAWFYPGDNVGQEFAYPKSQAEQLSRLNNKQVPTLEERGNETAAQNSNAASQNPPTAQPNPVPASPPAAEANPTPPPSAANPPATQMAEQQKPELPHTAGSLPMVAMAGVLLIGIAMMLRAILRASV